MTKHLNFQSGNEMLYAEILNPNKNMRQNIESYEHSYSKVTYTISDMHLSLEAHATC